MVAGIKKKKQKKQKKKKKTPDEVDYQGFYFRFFF